MKVRKVGVLFILLIIFGFFSAVFVLAQSPIPDREQIENDSVVKGVKDLQEKVNEERWEYISESWKELLLNNSAIKKIDSGFRRINFLFVIFLAQDYDFSATLFIVFLLWLAIAISSGGYFAILIADDKVRLIPAVAVAIILAHMRVLYFIAVGLFKIATILFLGREGGIWTALGALVVFLGVVVLFYVNTLVSKKISKGAKEGMQRGIEKIVKTQEKFQEGVSKGMD